MKIRILIAIALISLFAVPVFPQYARRIVSVTALPALCNPLNGDVVNLTAAGPTAGIYSCTGTNTWQPAGTVGSGFVLNQGTLTAQIAAISTSATWNNAAVTFAHWYSNVTNTASNAASSLIQLQVGGADRFRVQVDGDAVIQKDVYSTAGSFVASASGSFAFVGRSVFVSPTNGILVALNNAQTDFTRLNLGPVAVTHPGIAVSPAVGGQTQGIIIAKGDGTLAAFADLGAATNGSMIYCSNCTVANPCAGAGTGAIAKRLNGAWVCN